MSRRITVRVRGLPVDVVYADRGGGELSWWFATVNWRMLDYDRISDLTRAEILAIDAACIADLRERRVEWTRRLRSFDKSRHSSGKSRHAR